MKNPRGFEDAAWWEICEAYNPAHPENQASTTMLPGELLLENKRNPGFPLKP
jgi:hypothetical protein